MVDYLTPITRRILMLVQAYCQHQLSEMRGNVQNDRAKSSQKRLEVPVEWAFQGDMAQALGA
ncbi:hypothetical protein IB229_02070 [Pseudomonas sp. PDM14]|uniref:hypothetical protein n=1 Tax=Pseudomonas sp. PDM14 TaxID=2769288 RepID=UPI00177C1A52|nr:hypothetical protein [Pseudomonas sp. PDM14]MBD9481743.1 hypothetical protein [Pseudomonas sp. PDM14]